MNPLQNRASALEQTSRRRLEERPFLCSPTRLVSRSSPFLSQQDCVEWLPAIPFRLARSAVICTPLRICRPAALRREISSEKKCSDLTLRHSESLLRSQLLQLDG